MSRTRRFRSQFCVFIILKIWSITILNTIIVVLVLCKLIILFFNVILHGIYCVFHLFPILHTIGLFTMIYPIWNAYIFFFFGFTTIYYTSNERKICKNFINCSHQNHCLDLNHGISQVWSISKPLKWKVASSLKTKRTAKITSSIASCIKMLNESRFNLSIGLKPAKIATYMVS